MLHHVIKHGCLTSTPHSLGSELTADSTPWLLVLNLNVSKGSGLMELLPMLMPRQEEQATGQLNHPFNMSTLPHVMFL